MGAQIALTRGVAATLGRTSSWSEQGKDASL